jgi:hypothetical protein
VLGLPHAAQLFPRNWESDGGFVKLLQHTNTKVVASAFGYSSMLCSLAVWIEALVEVELSRPVYEPPLRRWVTTLFVSIVLSVAASVFGARRWALAVLLPVGTLLLLDYIIVT